jgi:hypothetical protein
VVELTMARKPATVTVRLAAGAESGLASIVEQYLRQQLEGSERQRRRATRLRGRVALTAVDHEATVTVELTGDEIIVWDGERRPVDASIAGPSAVLTRVLQGRANLLVEHLRGHLRVRSSFKKPFFPLRFRSLMKLPAHQGA